jgi:transcriptional regulator with XRE-family HTH domain
MTLGEKLKQLRTHKGLSQPELAESAGIEQSYLSKLENDKSMPSNDIFRRLLTSLDINLPNFLSQFDEHYVRSTLCQIEDVENHYYKQQSEHRDNSRRLLIISSLLIAVATSFFYAGVTSALFPERIYDYESTGIILEGEPIDLYEGGHRRLVAYPADYGELEKEFSKRFDKKRVSLDRNKGRIFTTDVEGGRRTYKRQGDSYDVDRVENAILQVLGIFLFSVGIMGFVFEFRMSKYNRP